MKKVRTLIRYVLTLLLIYGSYTETGKFTALALLLIFIAIEISTATLVAQTKKE